MPGWNYFKRFPIQINFLHVNVSVSKRDSTNITRLDCSGQINMRFFFAANTSIFSTRTRETFLFFISSADRWNRIKRNVTHLQKIPIKSTYWKITKSITDKAGLIIWISFLFLHNKQRFAWLSVISCQSHKCPAHHMLCPLSAWME